MAKPDPEIEERIKNICDPNLQIILQKFYQEIFKEDTPEILPVETETDNA